MSKAVLIVEDDARFRTALERIVARMGYEARSAEDGVAALRSIRAERPGLVLLDLLLPRKDGYAVLEDLSRDRIGSELTVVPMSAVYRDVAAVKRLKELGCEEFLEKPFDEAALETLLRKYLGRPEKMHEAEVQAVPETPRGESGVAATLWRAIEEGASGALHVQRGKAKKVVLLERGQPVAIHSNLVRECLGRRLLAQGSIDRATLDRSVAQMRERGQRQGEVLVALGALEPESLARALVEQGRAKLADLLGWEQARTWFEAEAAELSRATALEAGCPQAMLIDAAGRAEPARVERALARAEREGLRVDVAGLTPGARALPQVAALLHAMENGAERTELVSAHGPALFGLGLVGLLDATGAAAPAAEPGKLGLPELRELAERQASQDHFEVLGIGLEASQDRVQAAFFELAKRLHPDRYGTDAEARELASKIFARVTDAHETLSDPGQRREYEAKLDMPDQDPDKLGNELVRAELEFQKGLALLKQRNYPEALEHLDSATRLAPSEGEIEALYGWTYFLASPGVERAGEKAAAHLENARKLSPNSAEAHYYSGLLQKACGERSQAERMFGKAVGLDPNHVEAARELRLINMRRGVEKPRSEGIFGFGRKKK